MYCHSEWLPVLSGNLLILIFSDWWNAHGNDNVLCLQAILCACKSFGLTIPQNLTTWLVTWWHTMSLLPDAWNCGLRMSRECRERFPPPPTSKEIASYRPRHASRHVRDARAVMHVGIAYPRWRGKRSWQSWCMRTRNFTYLARGPYQLFVANCSTTNGDKVGIMTTLNFHLIFKLFIVIYLYASGLLHWH